MYEKILKNTLDILENLPTPIPENGDYAGIVKEYRAEKTEMFLGDNYHYAMGNSFLKYGVLGVALKVKEKALSMDEGVDREMMEGIAETYTAISAYLSRYSDAIKAVADKDARLLHIAENLDVLSKKAPIHFDEAIQLVYIMWKLRTLWKMHSDIGRLDYHLKDFFLRDIESGYINEGKALDLICQFWELLNKNDSGDTLGNVMVGGMNPDGSDSSTRLSVLMLEASRRVAKSEPHINVRVHKNMREDLYQKMLEVQLMGAGQATMYNDEVVIPSLEAFGIPHEWACNYANDGCSEVTLDGMSGIDYEHIDVVGVFELAFNNGKWAERNYRSKVHYWHKDKEDYHYITHAVPGFQSGKVEECTSFDEFYQMFLKQYEMQVRNKASVLHRLFLDRKHDAATSLLLNGTYECVLDRGKDILRGGFLFDEYMLFSGSIPTVADCLISLKKLVFEKKLFSIAEIKEAIRVDFEGYEVMRKMMLAQPKFGNDIDEVDLLSKDIASHFCDWLEEYRNETGFAVMPSLYGFRFVEEAYSVAATPDGRHFKDSIAEHYNATPGRATHGPTAVIRSIAKAKEEIFRSCGVCAVHVSLPRNLGNSDEESLLVLDGLVNAARAGGLNHMNIGIYDASLLRRAQMDPENHKDIVVRVWGYSAHFVDLCKEMQDHVISRVA